MFPPSTERSVRNFRNSGPMHKLSVWDWNIILISVGLRRIPPQRLPLSPHAFVQIITPTSNLAHHSLLQHVCTVISTLHCNNLRRFHSSENLVMMCLCLQLTSRCNTFQCFDAYSLQNKQWNSFLSYLVPQTHPTTSKGFSPKHSHLTEQDKHIKSTATGAPLGPLEVSGIGSALPNPILTIKSWHSFWTSSVAGCFLLFQYKWTSVKESLIWLQFRRSITPNHS